jgi:hypothetical protein
MFFLASLFLSYFPQMQTYTKSTDWYDDTDGWKSTQGGFSAVATVSTDDNNMGGFFIRKMTGATTLGWCLIKVWPLFFLYHHNNNMSNHRHQNMVVTPSWHQGHYLPLLYMIMVGNCIITIFLALQLPQWYQEQSPGTKDVSMVQWAYLQMTVLLLETIVVCYYTVTCRRQYYNKNNNTTAVAYAMPSGKTPTSTPSNIVTRTVMLITGMMTVLAIRDVCFTGHILEFWPRDDIYLEWTNALQHSPPPGSPEYEQDGGAIQAALYVGDKFIAQYMAIHLFVISITKLMSATTIRVGSDGRSGMIQAKILWQGATIANVLLMVVLRVFQPAAASASWDLRYALIVVGYETFVL